MSEGKKFDQGKIQPSIILGDFSRALTEVCKVGGYGIEKYGPRNWLLVKDAEKRYEDALLRHWLNSKVERIDQESQLLHLTHLAWNAIAILELELRKIERLSAPKTNDRTEEIKEMLKEKIFEMERKIADRRAGP